MRRIAAAMLALALIGSVLALPPTMSAAASTGAAIGTRVAEDTRGGAPAPDRTGAARGGTAARLYVGAHAPIPGSVFMLMATAGSTNRARVYDRTAYAHRNRTFAEARRANVVAVQTVERMSGEELDLLDLTSAPGGGPSGGAAYVLAYLNVLSDGGVTGELRIAATGELDNHGYIHPVTAIDEKTAAAAEARADVLFVPSFPSDEHPEVADRRRVGELMRPRFTGSALSDERQLHKYVRWGTDRPSGLDVVGVRHVADMVAYLCGTGSQDACGLLRVVVSTTLEIERPQSASDDGRPERSTAPPGTS